MPAGIQFRLLNRRKGPAVRGPRTQADRKLYRLAMQDGHPRSRPISMSSKARSLISISRMTAFARLSSADGRQLSCGAVVLTTGTFLRGLIHIGETQDRRRPDERSRPRIGLVGNDDSVPASSLGG